MSLLDLAIVAMAVVMAAAVMVSKVTAVAPKVAALMAEATMEAEWVGKAEAALEVG